MTRRYRSSFAAPGGYVATPTRSAMARSPSRTPVLGSETAPTIASETVAAPATREAA